VKSGDPVDHFTSLERPKVETDFRPTTRQWTETKALLPTQSKRQKVNEGRLSEADQASSFLVAADGIVNQRRQPLFDREGGGAKEKKSKGPAVSCFHQERTNGTSNLFTASMCQLTRPQMNRKWQRWWQPAMIYGLF